MTVPYTVTRNRDVIVVAYIGDDATPHDVLIGGPVEISKRAQWLLNHAQRCKENRHDVRLNTMPGKPKLTVVEAVELSTLMFDLAAVMIGEKPPWAVEDVESSPPMAGVPGAANVDSVVAHDIGGEA